MEKKFYFGFVELNEILHCHSVLIHCVNLEIRKLLKNGKI